MWIDTPLCRYWITLYRYVLLLIVSHVDHEIEADKQFFSNSPRRYLHYCIIQGLCFSEIIKIRERTFMNDSTTMFYCILKPIHVFMTDKLRVKENKCKTTKLWQSNTKDNRIMIVNCLSSLPSYVITPELRVILVIKLPDSRKDIKDTFKVSYELRWCFRWQVKINCRYIKIYKYFKVIFF
jgi:hypothetical protein